MTLPRLYPILDSHSLARRGLELAAAAEAFLHAGARILQIRHKRHWTRQFFQQAEQVAALCRQFDAPLVVNDRADFALLLKAGLHLGQQDLAPLDARRFLGGHPVIGFSSHNADQFADAAREPVDYLALGPVFSTASKTNPAPMVGVDEVRRLQRVSSKPLVAIGGITRENALEVLRAGAHSVAVIGDLLPPQPTPESLRRRMREWQQLLNAA
jgi:thiamine-phosphate pyrophosphorylase